MDCNICCEATNGKNKPVTCGFCEFSACSRCTERYLLETHDDAHCMSCRKDWDRGTLSKHLTQNFLNKEYKARRREVLLDREKSLLPQTQPDVEHELAERQRKKLLDQLIAEKSALQRKLRELQDTISDLRYGEHTARPESNTTTRKCPVEDCRGFLSKGWKCGICETVTCKDCNEPKGEDHVCDPNNVETMRLLKTDSKPCPSCGTLITKIDGCDQMWCTQPTCHTAFSWRSGKKVFGVIHNPHFVQFAATNGGAERNPEDVPCGGLPGAYAFFNRVRRYESMINPGSGKILGWLTEAFRAVRHATNVEERRYRVEDVVNTNADLRVKYLLKEMTEEHLAKMIMDRDTARKKKKSFHDIIVMFTHTATDIFITLEQMLTPQTYNETQQQLDVLDRLRVYANDQFVRVGQLYKCKHPRITSNWEFERFV